MSTLIVDAGQIEAFVNAMFMHADADTYASARTFLELEEGPPIDINGVRLNGDLAILTKAMIGRAQLAADYAKPSVFAPPLATFVNAKKAREVDLKNGLALSVELDQNAAAARQSLEFLLGTATVVVASGGAWSDPDTGEVQNKLHLHWRLKEPTRAPEAHKKLKEARTLATRLVGGDASNKPVVHPIRWPGSWHRKAEPKLCQIVELSSAAEIDLDVALAALADIQAEPHAANSAASDHDNAREMAELVRRITTGEEYHTALRDLAWRFMQGGMPDASIVLTLRGLMDGSTGPHDGRWQHRRDQIPGLVSTARAKTEPLPLQTPSKRSLWHGASQSGSDDRYLERALASELALVASAPEGRRNNQLNKSAVSLFRFATEGRLPARALAVGLAAAALAAGLADKEIRATLRAAATKRGFEL